MAKLVAGKTGFDMSDGTPFRDGAGGPPASVGSSLVEWIGRSGVVYKYFGEGIVYTANTKAGTITGFTFTNPDGQVEVTVTGGSMTVMELSHLFEQHDMEAFESEFFNGNDTFVGSAKPDVLLGFAGNDTITGGRGADMLDGGDGHDVFIYKHASDSAGTNFDTINGIDFLSSDSTSDKLKLPFAVNDVLPEITTGKLTLSNFNALLAKAVNGNILGPHDAVLFDPSSGGEKHQLFLVIDANGTAGYQAGKDIVIHLTDAVHTDSLGGSDFTS
jgi:Ca2+-binding RTX toxin-like protein